MVMSILFGCTVDLLEHSEASSVIPWAGVCGIVASGSIPHQASKVTEKPLYLLESSESYSVCKDWDGIPVKNAQWTVLIGRTDRAAKRSANVLPATAPAPIAMPSNGPRPERAKRVKTVTASSDITYSPGPDPKGSHPPERHNKASNSTAEER